MAPITEPLQDVEIDIPDADLYEDKFAEQERNNNARNYAHLIVWKSQDTSTMDMTACGLFWPTTRPSNKPWCPECVEYTHTHQPPSLFHI